MYRFSWKHALVECALICVAVYMVLAGCAAGWFIFGLRDARMFTWCMFLVLPSAIAPFIVWKLRLERVTFQGGRAA